ncbi:type II toxin-antitoxin system ParD family antitoxin [Consotaella aegiceratis]|uniref:type II toxin-antitoxin system ParD family antitoxin n=1 Tax=Consotaella aegiceratis TaxID=3097961 RepID=UPI002F3FB4BA
MPAVEKRTVSLPAEHASFIDKMVSSGAYSSASEVVRAGLRALQERDAAVERWLREEVAPVYDAMQTDPARAHSLDDVFADLRERHARRLAGRK